MNLQLSIDGYSGNIYDSVVTHGNQIKQWDKESWKILEKNYTKKHSSSNSNQQHDLDRTMLKAQEFLARFDSSDFSSVCFPKYSQQTWEVTENTFKKINKNLESGKEVVEVNWQVHRANGKHKTVANSMAKTNTTYQILKILRSNYNYEVNNSDFTTPGVKTTLSTVLPRIIWSKDQSEFADEIAELTGGAAYRMNLKLERVVSTDQTVPGSYWFIDNEIVENTCTDGEYNLSCYYTQILKSLDDSPLRRCHENYIEILVISDKTAPDYLTMLSNLGILGLYVSLVAVVGRMMRSGLNWGCGSVMWLELPNVDIIWNMFSDLHMVREMSQWELEEDLTSKLVFLFRCPTALIKYTRHRPNPKRKIREEKEEIGKQE